MAEEKLIGRIVHYYTHLGVGIIELSDELNAGDRIHIKGHSEDFEQAVDSMQVEHQNVDSAKSGQSIGIKLDQKVHEGDEVYKISG